VKVLVADKISEKGIDILKKARADVETKTGLKPEELATIIGDYDALIVRSLPKVTADVIKAGKNLKVIARAGAGVDNIDVEEATRQGILVVNAPVCNTIAVAEHVFGLMLALARHIPQSHHKLKSGVWAKSEYMGIELRRKTLGLIGFGRIGSEVAKRALAFEMKVIAHDPYVPEDSVRKHGVDPVTLEQLLKESDYISLHAFLSPSTRGMIGKKELAQMKPTARLINCGRGELIDEEALAEALFKDKLAGAAVDVFCEEPATKCVLLDCDNLINTPHLAASTKEAQVDGAITVAEQIIDVFQGKVPQYPVNKPEKSAR
jgi:D-3-phosphoglycerate dehydrogenase